MLLDRYLRWNTIRALVLAALCLPLLAGCKPQEQITRYTVKKQHLINTASAASNQASSSVPGRRAHQQILGAIVLAGDVGWFFKVTDAPELVAPHAEAFTTFIKSLRFSGGPDPEPQWTLPEGWRQMPASGLRHATIQMPPPGNPAPGAAPVEMSVSRLGKSGVEDDEYVLTNLNRWRGQVNLPPISADELAKNTQQFKVDGRDGFLVDITGVEAASSAMPFAPFAGGAPPPLAGSSPPERAPNVAAPAAGRKSALKFDQPEGWTEGATTQFRKASFAVSDGARKAEITVIDLSAEGNDWLTNVNRWRGQVGLPPTTAAELEKTTKMIDVGSAQGQYAELVGASETTLGVMAVRGDKAWFVKLKGDKQLADREKANFEKFVKSLQLE